MSYLLDTNVISEWVKPDFRRRIDGQGCAMPEPISLLMIQFLEWISGRRRTYAEAMDAWRTSCPRLSVWEDALSDRLIQVEPSEVTLTPRGREILEGKGAAPDRGPQGSSAPHYGTEGPGR